MSKLNLTQKVARIIGKKTRVGSTYFNPDIFDPDNQVVYTQFEPITNSKSLGCVEASDLSRIAKARIQSLLTKRTL